MPSHRSSQPDKPRMGREFDREWHDYSIPADPYFAELCAMSISMWTAGSNPQDITTWLETKQDGCVVNLSDQLFAIHGLKPYRHEGLSMHTHRHPTASRSDPLEME